MTGPKRYGVRPARPKTTGDAPAKDGRSGGAGERKAPPKPKSAPRGAAPGITLDAPPPTTVFRDRDGQKLTFPDSNLKRVAAKILTERNKPWRYRPFTFPLFTPNGNEQAFHFDFYIYDNMDTVVRLILVVPRESREVWDRIGRFKRQYPMYTYELWTTERLAQLSKPRARLGF